MALVKAGRIVLLLLVAGMGTTGSELRAQIPRPRIPTPADIKPIVEEAAMPIVADAIKAALDQDAQAEVAFPLDDLRSEMRSRSDRQGVLYLDLERGCAPPTCKVMIGDKLLKPFGPPPNTHEVRLDVGSYRVIVDIGGRQEVQAVAVPPSRKTKSVSLKVRVPEAAPEIAKGRIRLITSGTTSVTVNNVVRAIAGDATIEVGMGEHTIQFGTNPPIKVTVSAAQPTTTVHVLLPPPAAPPMIVPVGGLIEWKPVAGGTIEVGCIAGDTSCRPNEKRRSVQVRPFQMMATEVTIGTFEEWLVNRRKAEGYERPEWTTAIPVAELARHPVARVTWQEAYDFCQDHKARLPRDEEWEAAARQAPGGASRMFAWDPGFDALILSTPKPAPSSGPRQSGIADPPPGFPGNFADQAARRKFTDWVVLPDYDDMFPYSAPVGHFLDVKGVHDLAGNVWEWTATDDEERPGRKITRGGSWTSRPPVTLRISHRVGSDPAKREDDLGFRCAR